MQLVTIDVADPDDLLDGYGAGALARIERDTTSAMSGASEVHTIAIVAATPEYEWWDATGTASHWYRVRYSTASPILSTDYSGYGAAFQPGGGGAYTDADRLLQRIGDSGQVATSALVRAAAAANAEINAYLGGFLGPSTDATRTLDGCEAVRNGTRLWVPGGIRTLTAISMGYAHNSTATAGVTTDCFLGPRDWAMAPGHAYQYIDVASVTGPFSSFPAFRRNVLLTGAFGDYASPDHVVEIADQLGVWKWQAKQSGTNVATGDFVGAVYPFLTAPQKAILDQFRPPLVR